MKNIRIKLQLEEFHVLYNLLGHISPATIKELNLSEEDQRILYDIYSNMDDFIFGFHNDKLENIE